MPDGTLINVCVHKSDGCRRCYAEMLVRRYWRKAWGEFPGYTTALLKIGAPVLVETELHEVLKLSRKIASGKAEPEVNKVFWNDMTDEYLDYWPDEFIDKCWAIRSLTPNLIHQVLTKRPDRMLSYFSDPYHMNRAREWAYVYDLQRVLHEAASTWPLFNAHLGVSAETQKEFNERWRILREIPAAVRFLSLEPLLGPIDPQTEMWEDCGPFVWPEWTIIGGESGAGHRSIPDGARWIEDAVTAFRQISKVFVKQDSGPRPGMQGRIPDEFWLKEFPVSQPAA